MTLFQGHQRGSSIVSVGCFTWSMEYIGLIQGQSLYQDLSWSYLKAVIEGLVKYLAKKLIDSIWFPLNKELHSTLFCPLAGKTGESPVVNSNSLIIFPSIFSLLYPLCFYYCYSWPLMPYFPCEQRCRFRRRSKENWWERCLIQKLCFLDETFLSQLTRESSN